MSITITELPIGGVGVHVHTEGKQTIGATDKEGAAWVGLSQAVNRYMHSVGAPGFDCLKAQGPQQ
jgi:hypothetical protein